MHLTKEEFKIILVEYLEDYVIETLAKTKIDFIGAGKGHAECSTNYIELTVTSQESMAHNYMKSLDVRLATMSYRQILSQISIIGVMMNAFIIHICNTYEGFEHLRPVSK